MKRPPPEPGSRRIADMVREVLAEPDLDRDVRALAVERLEESLTRRARAVAGVERDLTVTLGDDGVPRVTERGGPVDDPRLASSLDLELLANIAPVMGAARLDVKSGDRPKRSREAPTSEPGATPVEAATWARVTRLLVRAVTLQHQRIATLEAALGASLTVAPEPSELREIMLELQAMDQMMGPTSRP